MTRGKKAFIALGGALVLLILALGLAVFYAVGPGGDGLLARVILSDGTELRVEQTYTGDILEAYEVGFFVKTPQGQWMQALIGREGETRWPSARLEVDEPLNVVRIYQGKKLRAEYHHPGAFLNYRGDPPSPMLWSFSPEEPRYLSNP